MKRKFLAIAALAVTLLGANSANAVYCNALGSRCIYSMNWDNSGSVQTCADVTTSSSCTPACIQYQWDTGMCAVWGDKYADGCGTYSQIFPGHNCSTLRETNTSEPAITTCGTSGAYCGWRDGSNKSPAAGTTHAARAKLHSCATNGYSDESTYDTLFECTSGNPHTKNLYCTDSVWDTLCNEWL